MLIALAMISLVACNKKNEPEKIKNKPNCIFDSNIEDYINCLNPTLNIYIDNVFVGVWPNGQLDSAYVGAIPNNKNIADAKVYVTLPPGEHTYHTIFYSGEILSCEFQTTEKKFVVEETGMSTVLIDFASNVKVTSDTVLDIFGQYKLKVPKEYVYSLSYGDCSYSFKTYSDNGNTIEWDNDIYATDTLYELRNEYVRKYKLPQTDSVIRSQTFPYMEIIGEKGVLYYVTDKISSGYFFIKQEDFFILLFSVVLNVDNISELKNILLTVEKL